MAVRGVDDDDVDARGHERFDALLGVAADAHRRAAQQAFAAVIGGVGIVLLLLDVLDGDQAAQCEAVVHHQHLLDAVLVQQLQDFVVTGAFAHGDEAILLGHDVADRIVELLLEAHVASGDDADELAAVVDHRHAGDVARAGELEHVADGGVGADGEGFLDHAGFEFLDPGDFRRLAIDRHVLVQDADAAELGHRDGEARFGDGVHGGGHDREVQAEVAGEPRCERDVLGQDDRVRRDEGDVVVGECFDLDAEHVAVQYRRSAQL
jgi:hypothetical protein